MVIKVIGDVHLGIKDRADDFYVPYLKKEDHLIELFNSDADRIIVNGDFIDGWESDVNEVMKKYKRVMKAIEENMNKIRFIKGNHDNVKDFPFAQTEKLVIGDYLFMHGNQFDIFNSKWRGIGWAVTKVGAFIERLGWRDVDKVWARLRRGKFGTNEQYKKCIEKWLKRNPDYMGKIVVFSHTHEYLAKPQQPGDLQVRNSGTWTGEKMDVLELEI